MNTEYSKYIQKAEVRKTSELKHHNDLGPGRRYVFLDHIKIPRTTIYAIVRSASNITRNQPMYVEDHAHSVDSCFLFMGEEKDLKGLTAEIFLEDERYIVESPAAVFIPKEVRHSYRLIDGSGKYINILSHGNYNEATK